MWIYCVILISLLSAAESLKCQKCETTDGDCNTGICEGGWCSASILENKATGTKRIRKDCATQNPIELKEDGCVKDLIPEGESYRCSCTNGDFCNSEANVARMKDMLNNRFVIGSGITNPGGNGPAVQFPNNPNSPIGGPVQQGNQFPFNANNSFAGPGQPGSIFPNQQPNPTDFGSQQAPNQFTQPQPGNPSFGGPQSQSQPTNINGQQQQQNGNFQFPPQNGPSPQFPSQNGNNPQFPIQNGQNPQFPTSNNNGIPATNPNVQFPTNAVGNNQFPSQGNNFQGNPNPQNQQFPQNGFGGSVPSTANLPGNQPNQNANSQPNFVSGINGSQNFGGNSGQINDFQGNNQNGIQQQFGSTLSPSSVSNSASARLHCACTEPSCNGPCTGAVCYTMTFAANSVQNQAFAGRQGEAVQSGCSDDPNVIIGGAQHLRRDIKDYKFKINGQDIIVPAQAYYCRDGNYCNGIQRFSASALVLVVTAIVILAFSRH